jgi:uncharacterized protein (DUF1800 family)
MDRWHRGIPAFATSRSDSTARVRIAVAAIVAIAVLAPSPPAVAGGGASKSAVSALRAARNHERLLAGHLLRRIGFGPNRRDMREVLRLGRDAYVELQLHPQRIDDRLGERLFGPAPDSEGDSLDWQQRWLTRMAFSRRQLQEKMTLFWHEHFSTSVAKVGSFSLMRDHERLLRRHALGSFRELLIAMSKDNAMLFFLDNDANDGLAVDAEGMRVPPNENYARELLQLFSLGVYRLNMDGTLILDDHGHPLPAYTETDVKEVARALTGWYANYPLTNPQDPSEYLPPAVFEPAAHDSEPKIVLGEIIEADYRQPARDVERVVDVIMRHPNTAPFIAKELVLKFATETPSPAYVERVARVFADSAGDIRATVRAMLTDPEFYSPSVVRSQYKTPLEHVIGAVRGLGATGSRGHTLYYWAFRAGHLPYLPPSVFSFYRPGNKAELVNAFYVAVRDQASDMLASGYVDAYYDAYWDAGAVLRRRGLSRHQPDKAIDVLAQDLLAAPLPAAVRRVLRDYIGPQVTEEKLRGAAWLLMCSAEYQVN